MKRRGLEGWSGAGAAPSYPTALSRLTSSESFDSGAISNVTGRHLRQLIGNDLPQATPVDDAQVLEWWENFYVDRVIQKFDTLTVVSGEPGIGKSQFSVWLAAHVRDRLGRETGTTRTFNLETDLCYRLTTLTHRIYQSSRAKPSVLVADEGVLVGAQATSGISGPGAVLDRILSLCRVQAVTLFILSPSIFGVMNAVRSRRAKIWMHVERRGVTSAFQLKTALEWTPPRLLPFARVRRPWGRIRWPNIEDSEIWKQYEPAKVEITLQALTDAEIEASRFERAAGMRPPGPWAMNYWESPKTRGPTKVSDDLARKIRDLRASGKSVRSIMEKLRVGQRKVSDILGDSQTQDSAE